MGKRRIKSETGGTGMMHSNYFILIDVLLPDARQRSSVSTTERTNLFYFYHGGGQERSAERLRGLNLD